MASRSIVPGTVLTLEDIAIKVSRPKGIKPEKLFDILGKSVITSIEADAPIKLEDLKLYKDSSTVTRRLLCMT